MKRIDVKPYSPVPHLLIAAYIKLVNAECNVLLRNLLITSIGSRPCVVKVFCSIIIYVYCGNVPCVLEACFYILGVSYLVNIEASDVYPQTKTTEVYLQ